MTHSWIGLDIEGNGFFRYPERVCLIQISIGSVPYLIDPLDVEDMEPLGKVLIDSNAVELIKGTEVDYVDGLMRSGFVISNPNLPASSGGGGCGGGGGGCGCGSGGGGCGSAVAVVVEMK